MQYHCPVVRLKPEAPQAPSPDPQRLSTKSNMHLCSPPLKRKERKWRLSELETDGKEKIEEEKEIEKELED